MSKKDYERAARIAQRFSQADGEWSSVVDAFAQFFCDDGNPRFDATRFQAACQPGANVRARPRKAVA
jgi:hypothetical protein